MDITTSDNCSRFSNKILLLSFFGILIVQINTVLSLFSVFSSKLKYTLYQQGL